VVLYVSLLRAFRFSVMRHELRLCSYRNALAQQSAKRWFFREENHRASFSVIRKA